MKISIVKQDKKCIIDGEALVFEFPLAENIWSVQWDGATGEIEYTDKPNEIIDDITIFKDIIDMFYAKKQTVIDEIEAQKTTPGYLMGKAAIGYANELSKPFVFNGNPYQVDLQSQQYITGRAVYATLSKNDPAHNPWNDKANFWIDFNNTRQIFPTPDAFLLFASAVHGYVAELFDNYQTAKTLIREK